MATVSSINIAKGEIFTTAHLASIIRCNEGYGVVTGCDVHEQSPAAMGVTIDSGAVLYGGNYVSVAGGNITIDAADSTYPRFDVVYVNASGSIQVAKGTAAEILPTGETVYKKMHQPAPPSSIPAGVILARIYVPPGATSITNSYIDDIAMYSKDVPLGVLTARGDIPYRGVNMWTKLAKGTTGQVLMQGADDPYWGLPKLDALSAPDDTTTLNVSSTAHGLCPKHPNDKYKLLRGDGSWSTPPLWATIPGTPTRISNTQFSITDTGNANKYDVAFGRGTLLHWYESSTYKTAIVTSATYSSNAVTITIAGDALGTSFTSMRFSLVPPMQINLPITGWVYNGTDVSDVYFAPCNLYKIMIDVRAAVTGSGTGSIVFDVNDDGTSIITTKPSISAGSTSSLNNVCDSPTTAITAGSAVTVDVDSTPSGYYSPFQDVVLTLYVYPESWRYIP
ncbi:MAG TPA: hypothetical protein PK659_09010 [Methanothrix sp.]|nr:hypothetical protein [Methanothrix sp.]HOL44376.1 hypothetical protein [Methanothrix sp.]